MPESTIDKGLFTDGQGRFLTQSLFLELGYNTPFCVYSLKDDDHEYKGQLYPSLKKLYLSHEDPVEYDFATQHLGGWRHWQRLMDNKLILPHIEEWREELELKLRSQAVRDIYITSVEGNQGSFQAAKWLADGGWNKRGPGRPSKAEVQREKKMAARISDEFSADIARMEDYKGR